MITKGVDFTGQQLFTVMQGTSFTVPDTITVASPTSEYLAKSLDTKRAAVGGQLIFGLSDGPVIHSIKQIGVELKPKDVVAVSAIVGGVANVTVNGVLVAKLPGVAVVHACGVVG